MSVTDMYITNNGISLTSVAYHAFNERITGRAMQFTLFLCHRLHLSVSFSSRKGALLFSRKLRYNCIAEFVRTGEGEFHGIPNQSNLFFDIVFFCFNNNSNTIAALSTNQSKHFS